MVLVYVVTYSYQPLQTGMSRVQLAVCKCRYQCKPDIIRLINILWWHAYCYIHV